MVNMELINKHFEKALNYIESDVVRDIIIKALLNVNEKFYTAGASSTGKYHPDYAAGESGLVRHTNGVVYFAVTLSDLECNECNQYEKDLLVGSSILHDTCKSGLNWDKKHSAHEHPLLVIGLLSDDDLTLEEIAIWNELNDIISSHMGEWNESKYSKTSLPKPTKKLQKLLHEADLLASRKPINLDIFDDDLPEVDIIIPIATEKQVNYIHGLIREARNLPDYDKNYDHLDFENMKMTAASKIISQLKELVPQEV